MSQEQKKQTLPPQQQDQQPGRQDEMTPYPHLDNPNYKGSGKLQDKVALVTGGDSGIGAAAAIAFAKEGADVSIVYLNEHKDAKDTQSKIEGYGRRCVLIPGDVGNKDFCKQAVEQTVKDLGRLDVLVNNAAQQYPQETIEDISEEQLEKTFRTNIFAMFFMVQAALRHLRPGSAIINTTSVTAYRGSPQLLDYSSTKGAIEAFTRSLSQNLAEKKIRVNSVAPGPIWTPLIPATFGPEKVKSFGADVPLGRPGQPSEVAPAFVFLASEDSSYITGQTIHPNGGEIING